MNKIYLSSDVLTKKTSLNHFLLIMRTAVILLFTCVFISVAETGHSQNAKVSLNKNNVNLKEVLNEIENQTDYLFIYNNQVNTDKRVSVNTDNTTVKEVLTHILKDSDIDFLMEGNHIILTYIEEKLREKDEEVVETVKQQGKTITGTIVDAQGDPIIGANVIEKGTTNGTVTDYDGNFSLNVDENAILRISYIGYLEQEIDTEGINSIDVVLQEDTKTLDELVVVGYGAMQKSHLTGAVGSVKIDETMANRPNSEFGKLLYGQVPGVQVRSTTGRPGTSSTIQIRGINSISAASSPLIVVDGVILPDYDLSTINPSDIESIDILKDAASAAIYGSRGSNGVILVTTRAGKKGKPSFSISHSTSIQKLIRKIDVMNSAEYAQATIDAAQNGWIDKGGDPNAPNTIEARGEYKYTWPIPLNNPESLYDTDWHDAVFSVAPTHKTDISLTGGDEYSTYYLSAGVLNQTGILMNTGFEKYSMNLKIDSEVSKRLKIGAMLNSSYDVEDRSGFTSVHVLTNTNQYPPVYPLYNKDGYLGGPHNTPGFENYENILYRVAWGHPHFRGEGETSKHKRLHLIGNVYGEVTILEGLTFKSSLDVFIRKNSHRGYQPSDRNVGPNIRWQAIGNASETEQLSYTTTNNINYTKDWKAHQIDAIVGYEFTQRQYYGLSGERRDYDNDLIHYLAAGKTIQNANDNAYRSALISGFGRINYNYEGKYMASASFRTDGSSRFGPNNKWGSFPSISAGWRISEEEFFKENNSISNLFIRTSYGFTGNESIGDYRWLSSMNPARVAIGSNLLTSYYPANVKNPDLRWERTKQLNFGLDIGLFNDRIFLAADYYNSNSDDLLLEVPIPATSGFTSMLTNIGKLNNKGIDLKLSTRNLTGELIWNSFITFSRSRNEIRALGADDAPIYYSPGYAMESINKVGSPIFSFFGLKYDGVYMNQAEIDADPAAYEGVHPGNGKYKDINGDNVIDSEDRMIIGDYQPDFEWAISNSFRYKNFDFSFLFQGVQGNDIFDLNIHRSWMYHEGRNYNRRMLDRWRSPQEPGDGYIPKLTVDLAKFDLSSSDYFIQDGSYIKLQEVDFGYNLPENIVKKYGINGVRIYFSGTNLFLITKSTVFDPENFSGDAGNTIQRGTNFSEYPSAKTYSLGININF